MDNVVSFLRPSYVNANVSGEIVDRLLLLSDLSDSVWGQSSGIWIRAIIRMYRFSDIPEHICVALDDIEERVLSDINSAHQFFQEST